MPTAATKMVSFHETLGSYHACWKDFGKKMIIVLWRYTSLIIISVTYSLSCKETFSWWHDNTNMSASTKTLCI